MAGIDYGAVVLKNGKRYKADKLYPLIDELGFLFYKCGIESSDGKEFYWFSGKKFSETIVFNGVKIRAKMLVKNKVFSAEFFNKEDKYSVIFGYGIDNSIDVWNKIKYRYLGRVGAREVDKWLKKKGVV